jgi:hypothetical protein
MDIDSFHHLYDDYLIVMIGRRTLATARSHVLGCESCDINVEIPFECVLDMVTGADPALTNYVIRGPLSCPCCSAPITEKTLVSLE